MLPFPPRWRRPRTNSPSIASFSILGDFVRQVGGDRIALDHAGAAGRRRPCLFADAERREEADCRQGLVFVNGHPPSRAGWTGWCSSSGAKATIVTATTGVKPRHHDRPSRRPWPDRPRPARLAVRRQCGNLRRQHPRCAGHSRSGGRRYLQGAMPRPISAGSICSSRRRGKRWRKFRRSGGESSPAMTPSAISAPPTACS